MRIFVLALAIFLIIVGYLLGQSQIETSRQELYEIKDWQAYKNFCDHMKKSRSLNDQARYRF